MEDFIKAVRQYPCLWNINDKDYRHGDRKDIAWKKIVDMSVPEITDITTAKSEWKKLRDCHRDSLKRQKSGKTGQAAPTVNTWKYAQIMAFLIPYMKSRKKSSYIANSIPTHDSSDKQPTENSSNEQSNQPSAQVPSTDEEESTTSSFPLEKGVEGMESTPYAQAKRKRNYDGNILDMSREMESNHNRRQEERDNIRRGEKKHSTDIFFESIAQTTKAMPTYLQNRIKKKVLQIVCETEEEYESYNYHRYVTTSTASTSTQSPPTYQ